MSDYLLFRLYGPLAAWGDIAVGEYRPSFAHPSKSAIVGLLAAALGIRRHEEERQQALAGAISFAVQVDAMGVLLRDYHTTQVPSARQGITNYTRRSELSADDLNTILSTRDYRSDAVHTVAITLAKESVFTVSSLVTALKRPVFTLYLGRKSCPPALPLQPQVVTAATLKEAMQKAEFINAELTTITDTIDFHLYWEDNITSGFERTQVISRRDTPRSRKRWQFSDRRENYCAIQKEG